MRKVEKTWGWEHWFVNTDKYCGKLLFIEVDQWSSKGAFHYHKIKDETFLVVSGGLVIDYIDEDSNETHQVILKRYESFRIKPNIKHRFKSFTEEGCHFIEASTTHREEDSYRVKLKNGKWEAV